MPGRGAFPSASACSLPQSLLAGLAVASRSQLSAHRPPELGAWVIRQLLQQCYPNLWMIQVIESNTPEPAIWLEAD
jgi:hypothetical protein